MLPRYMLRFIDTESGAPTYGCSTGWHVEDGQRTVSSAEGCNLHSRPDYDYDDLTALVTWLNEREAGYPVPPVLLPLLNRLSHGNETPRY